MTNIKNLSNPIFDLNKIAITKRQHSTNSDNQSKPPFLFVHGNSQNDTCGLDMLAYFYQKGHDVFAYDLPGHGDSPMQTEDYHFDDLVTLNYQLIKANQLHKPILCGHSLGGMIQASTLINYQLDASSLIFCGSYDASPVQAALSQSQEQEAELILRSLEQYIDEAFKLYKGAKKYNYFENLTQADELVAIFNRRYTHPVANQINLTTLKNYNVRSQLAANGIPILVLHGEQEDIIPASLVRAMQQAYQNMIVEWYPQGGHFAFYQEPELTRQYLDCNYQFLLGEDSL